VALADAGGTDAAAGAAVGGTRNLRVTRLASNLAFEQDGGKSGAVQKGEEKGESKGAGPTGKAPSKWEFNLTPYLWATGIEGNAGIRGHAAPVDASFIDILKHLDGGLMAAAEARKDRFGIIGEVLYVRLSHSESRPDRLITHTDLDLHQLMTDLGLEYRVIQARQGTFDLVAAARYWDLNASLGPTGARGGNFHVPATKAGSIRSWELAGASR
jgi:hypothetical protein